jgi:hypothetical protein
LAVQRIRAETNGPWIAHSLLESEGRDMIVAGGLAFLVVICLLLSMVDTPPAIGR